MKLRFLILVALMTIVCGKRAMQLPRTVFEWKQLEFNEYFDKHHLDPNLIPENPLPYDVQPFYDNENNLKVFVTVPRFKDGIPFSLATVSNKMGKNGPVLEPYPDYGFHSLRDRNPCQRINSPVRVAINECNHMWILDNGISNSTVTCPPKLMVFDLKDDRLIHDYVFDDSLYVTNVSLFVTPLVQVRNHKDPRCRDTMVYMADTRLPGLVVYDYKQREAWRIKNIFMYPNPNYGLLTVAGESFIQMDGIVGLTADEENLYFHPLASISEFSVPLNIINNKTLFEKTEENMYRLFVKLGERNSPCTASAIDFQNNVYCVTLNPIQLITWNTKKAYSRKNIMKLPIIPEQLEFVSGLKVVLDAENRQQLWLLSNKYQKYATGSQNFDEINFRILVLDLEGFGNSVIRWCNL